MYGKDGIIGFETDEDTYLYIKDSQDNISMLMCLNNNTCLARYEYDSFGNCTVYDGDGKINTDANFIGNVNPFRWKGLYYDTESNLYYANGSYYDPETGLYIDANPISTVIDNALLTRSLDRNGILCNNTIELRNNNTQKNLYSELVPVHNKRMLKALPLWLNYASYGTDILTSFLPTIEKVSWGLTQGGVTFTDLHYAVYGINRFTALDSLRSPLGKICNGIAIGLIALDLGLNIYNSVQQDYSVAQGITSFALTAIKDVGLYFLTASIARAVGAKIGAMAFSTAGPVGMFIGAAVGMVIGWLVDWLSTMFIDWIVGLFN